MTWQARFDQLAGFIKEHRRLPLLEDDPLLYGWIQEQQKKRAAGKLTVEQSRKLTDLPFWKRGERHALAWESQFGECVDWYARNDTHPNTNNTFFGRWTRTQRRKYLSLIHI